MAIQTTYGSIEVPVWPRGGIRDDVVAVAIGQGHTTGTYASLANDGAPGVARGAHVISLLPALTDESGGRAWLAARAQVTPTGRYQRLPFTQSTDNKRGRMLGESISLVALAQGETPFAANAPPFGAKAGGVRTGTPRTALTPMRATGRTATAPATRVRTRSAAPSTPRTTPSRTSPIAGA